MNLTGEELRGKPFRLRCGQLFTKVSCLIMLPAQPNDSQSHQLWQWNYWVPSQVKAVNLQQLDVFANSCEILPKFSTETGPWIHTRNRFAGYLCVSRVQKKQVCMVGVSICRNRPRIFFAPLTKVFVLVKGIHPESAAPLTWSFPFFSYPVVI